MYVEDLSVKENTMNQTQATQKIMDSILDVRTVLEAKIAALEASIALYENAKPVAWLDGNKRLVRLDTMHNGGCVNADRAIPDSWTHLYVKQEDIK